MVLLSGIPVCSVLHQRCHPEELVPGILVSRPKTQIVMVGAWGLDLLWAPLFIWGKPPLSAIAIIGSFAL